MGARRSLAIFCFSVVGGCSRVPIEEPGATPAQPPPPQPAVELQPPAPAAEAPAPAIPPHAPVSDGGNAKLTHILAQARAGRAHDRLVSLCDDIGHRLSGSESYRAAVDWGVERFREDGVPSVTTEAVQVPTWVRGNESAQLVSPRLLHLPMLGLGGSPGTPGVEAEVVVVPSVEAVDDSVRGRIVLFQTVMEQRVPAFKGYGDAVGARGSGPATAAKHGAVAALVRSMTTRSLATPHTGATWFEDGEPQIPAAAISTEHADLLARLVERGKTVRVRLEMEAHYKPDQDTHSVVAQIPGTTHPDEVVLIGAHLDSWDVGQGAHDDGAGVAHVIEAMRILAAMEPSRRTVRAVLFANEENGLRGGKAYFAAHPTDIHVAAIETDIGGGWPLSFGATGTADQLAWLAAQAAPLGLPVTSPGGGADISPLKQTGTLVVGMRTDDTHYFDVHHTEADTVDKVDPASLREGAGALAGLAWLLANAETAPLPSGEPHPQGG